VYLQFFYCGGEVASELNLCISRCSPFSACECNRVLALGLVWGLGSATRREALKCNVKGFGTKCRF